jgi:hypothetical protein
MFDFACRKSANPFANTDTFWTASDVRGLVGQVAKREHGSDIRISSGSLRVSLLSPAFRAIAHGVRTDVRGSSQVVHL